MPPASPRSSPQPRRIYRDECLALCVVRLAEAGFLHPGHRVGPLGLLVMHDEESPIRAAIRTFFGASEGVLRVEHDEVEDIRAVEVPTPIGARWRLLCPRCDRPVRRLYLPPVPVGLPVPAARFGCRHCLRLAYRVGGRREELQSGRESLAQIARDRAGLDALEKVIRWRMAELQAPGVRGPAS